MAIFDVDSIIIDVVDSILETYKNAFSHDAESTIGKSLHLSLPLLSFVHLRLSFTWFCVHVAVLDEVLSS